MPIARNGVTASHLALEFNGEPKFVVDLACFPGSSGSPIFVYNPDGYFDKKQNMVVMGKTRLKLVGILFAGPLVTNEGQIIFGNTPRLEVNSMMHLGYAFRSTTLLELEDHILRNAG